NPSGIPDRVLLRRGGFRHRLSQQRGDPVEQFLRLADHRRAAVRRRRAGLGARALSRLAPDSVRPRRAGLSDRPGGHVAPRIRERLQAQPGRLELGRHAGARPFDRQHGPGAGRRMDRLCFGSGAGDRPMSARLATLLAAAAGLAACGDGDAGLDQTGPRPELPEITQTLVPPMNIATPAGWDGERPTVPAGFTITALATDLQIPRQMLVLPNGDILVAEGSGGNAPKVRPKDVVAGL